MEQGQGLSYIYDLALSDLLLSASNAGFHGASRIFPLGLARRMPKSYNFVGFDISDDQFPIPESIPENVSFRVADAKRDPPAEFLGKFDIVHLRLFFCVVDNNDPFPPFNFCLKLLSKHAPIIHSYFSLFYFPMLMKFYRTRGLFAVG